MRTIILALMLTLCRLCFSQGISIVPPPSVTEIMIYDEHVDGNFMGESGGHCSGTKIGPHAILSAQHCLKNANRLRLYDEKEPRSFTVVLFDGNDHVIFLVDGPAFTDVAIVNEKGLIQEEVLTFWGSPGYNNVLVFSIAVYKGLIIDKEIDATGKLLFQKLVARIMSGDSGSGLFDTSGKVVAVINMADEGGCNGNSLPLAFTQEQLDIATEKRK